MPDTLQEAQIRVLELADCQERYSSTVYQVYDESICIFKLEDDDAHTASCYVSHFAQNKNDFFINVWSTFLTTVYHQNCV